MDIFSETHSLLKARQKNVSVAIKLKQYSLKGNSRPQKCSLVNTATYLGNNSKLKQALPEKTK